MVRCPETRGGFRAPGTVNRHGPREIPNFVLPDNIEGNVGNVDGLGEMSKEMCEKQFHVHPVFVLVHIDPGPGGLVDLFPRAASLEQLPSLLLVRGVWGTGRWCGGPIDGGGRRGTRGPGSSLC